MSSLYICSAKLKRSLMYIIKAPWTAALNALLLLLELFRPRVGALSLRKMKRDYV
jgi:hypothetical protein